MEWLFFSGWYVFQGERAMVGEKGINVERPRSYKGVEREGQRGKY